MRVRSSGGPSTSIASPKARNSRAALSVDSIGTVTTLGSSGSRTSRAARAPRFANKGSARSDNRSVALPRMMLSSKRAFDASQYAGKIEIVRHGKRAYEQLEARNLGDAIGADFSEVAGDEIPGRGFSARARGVDLAFPASGPTRVVDADAPLIPDRSRELR